MMRMICIFFVASLLVALPSQKTLACSGGTNREVDFSIDYMLDWSDFVVKAKVIASDEVNQNFILEVISSQKSMPPKQLVLANTSPFSVRSFKKFGQQGCSFGGKVHNVRIGDVGYFPLKRNPDGSYSTFLSLGYGVLYPKFDDQTFTYIKIDPKEDEVPENWQKVPIPTEERFIQIVQEKGGTAPVLNTTEISEFMPLPPTAPIYLTTDTGKHYMLPMDGGAVVPLEDNWLAKQLGVASEDCYQADCVLLSPDTSVELVRKSDHTLVFQYVGSACTYYTRACVLLEGQMGQFSTTNDALAVWNQSKLDIYYFVNQQQTDSTFPVPYKLISIPLKTTPEINMESLRNRAVWSNDGNVLVYADGAGLWGLDLYNDLTPHLILKGNNDRAILPISLTGNGRFLAYSLDGTRQNWILQDLQTDAKYPNLVLSPDGRYGVSFNNAKSTPLNSLLRVIYPQTFPEGGTWELNWTAHYALHYIKTCGSETGSCGIQFCGTSGNAASTLQSYACSSYSVDLPLNDADYDSELGLVYVSNDGHTVYSDSRLGYKWQPQVDGNIVDVEWMLPRFYYEYKHPEPPFPSGLPKLSISVKLPF